MIVVCFSSDFVEFEENFVSLFLCHLLNIVLICF